MARLAKGDLMPDFSYNTPFEAGLQLADTAAKAPATALLFLRYYGCTLCQMDLHWFKEEHAAIAAEGQLLVVLQSDAAGLAAGLQPGSFPYTLVCDPSGGLYRQLDIRPAKSKLALAGAKTLKKVAEATAKGFRHGAYEGDELQLPAAFVFGPDRVLTHARYATQAGEVPTPDEVARLLQDAKR